MSHDHLDWPRLFYREQFKEGDEEADRGNDGKTTSQSELALNGIILRKAENREEWRKLVFTIYSVAPKVSQTTG